MHHVQTHTKILLYFTLLIIDHQQLKVLGHPYFWSCEMQLDFIQRVSDCLVSKKNPEAANAKGDIERDAKDVIGADWMKKIDKVLEQGIIV